MLSDEAIQDRLMLRNFIKLVPNSRARGHASPSYAANLVGDVSERRGEVRGGDGRALGEGRAHLYKNRKSLASPSLYLLDGTAFFHSACRSPAFGCVGTDRWK